MHEPDPSTIRAAARGDTGAFEELVRAYQAPVWRFLRHLLRDPALAEDVTQETFIRVYRRLHTFGFRSKFSTWVFQVARNAGIDALRARDRRSRLLLAARPGSGEAPDPAARLELQDALDRLPPRLREAFLVIEVLGLSYREAGRTLDLPEGTVKSRVFRARRQLVEWLDDSREAADEV